MPDILDDDALRLLVYFVDDAVGSNSNAIQALGCTKLDRLARKGAFSKTLDALPNPANLQRQAVVEGLSLATA